MLWKCPWRPRRKKKMPQKKILFSNAFSPEFLKSLNLDISIVTNRGFNKNNRIENSVDPDEKAHKELSHHDLHYLQRTCIGLRKGNFEVSCRGATYNIMFTWRNIKNSLWTPPFIWSYGNATETSVWKRNKLTMSRLNSHCTSTFSKDKVLTFLICSLLVL